MRPLKRKTLTPLAFATVLISTVLLAPVSASATPVCGERNSLLNQLAGKYKEAPVSMGLAANGSVIEITKSDKGTWTILRTNPMGVTCMMAAGEYWEFLNPKKAEYQPS